MTLLPPAVRRESRIYPVGRLDEQSEGLLLFTNDGDWADLLLHPRYGVEREYMVGLDRSLRKGEKLALRQGIALVEGPARLEMLEDATPANVRNTLALLEPPHPELRWYRVVLEQGWKRQIRRMFDAVEVPVRRLVRVRIGSLKLTDLASGQARPLDRQEVRRLSARARRATSSRPPKGAANIGADVAE
jgi:pseudouridine synthase